MQSNKRILSKTHAHVDSRVFPTLRLPSSIVAIVNLVYGVLGDVYLDSRHAKEHAVALSILSECVESTDPTEKVACLLDNHHNSIHVQNKDVDKDIDNEEEIVLNSLLGVPDSKIISLIEVIA